MNFDLAQRCSRCDGSGLTCRVIPSSLCDERAVAYTVEEIAPGVYRYIYRGIAAEDAALRDGFRAEVLA